MKIIERIEGILSEYSWVWKICLVLLWLLWAAQLIGPLKGIVREEVKYQKNRNPELERAETIELANFAKSKVEKAKAEGISYSPEKYFADLKEITEKERQSRNALLKPVQSIIALNQIFLSNIKKGYYSESEIEKARSWYTKWNEESLSHREETFGKIKETGWQQILLWLIAFYLRSILLAFILYLVRMAGRKGILETILADKKRFVFATLGWVFFIHKYPFNVVREIRVEAELRRLGDLFRRFTRRERNLVREIANSDHYQTWLGNFRTKRKSCFEHGLLAVLLVTLFFYMLGQPVYAGISEGQSFHKNVAIQSIIDSGNDSGQLTNTHWINDYGLPAETAEMPAPMCMGFGDWLESIRCLIVVKEIDHIPLSPLGLKLF